MPYPVTKNTILSHNNSKHQLEAYGEQRRMSFLSDAKQRREERYLKLLETTPKKKESFLTPSLSRVDLA
jgi:hypothetical protein